MANAQSNYWLDVAARDISDKYPKGDLVVSSGISPSASYHIGHFRGIMTADALAWALRQQGRKVKHIHVVDNFDPLRKWYDFLPPSNKDYAGHPIALVPDPVGDCHKSYADHFYSEFKKQLKPMGIGGPDFEILLSYEDLYQTGKMAPYIKQSLESVDLIKKIFEAKSNRKLPEDWTPIQLVGDDGKFIKGDLAQWDKAADTINGKAFDSGKVKLDWRLDWPARWALLGVNVEPFGMQEHGAAGSSYDTGKEFAKQVFGVEPPYGEVQYGHIHNPGENIKMSSSKGNVVTPAEALSIMPPEILRYFIVRSRPERKIVFDRGEGLYNLVDEFAAAQADPHHEFRDAYNFAVEGSKEQIIASVPFKHLVQVYQAAQGDQSRVLELLDRTGWKPASQAEEKVLIKELVFVKNWLDKFAPEEVKFEIKSKLPSTELSEGQIQFLNRLADLLQQNPVGGDGQQMHQHIYESIQNTELKPAEAFQAIYQIILGQTKGPKAGWFLASLDPDWLIRRLKLQS